MPSISASATINQPVEKVFSYIISVDNHKTWVPSLKSARLDPAGPVAVGSMYVYGTDVMGRTIETKMQVTAFEPNKKWATKTVVATNPVETVYDFEAAGGGTKLTLTMNVPSGAYPAMAEGMIMEQMKKSLVDQAAHFKTVLEK